MFYGLIFVAILATSPVLTRDLKQVETVTPCGKKMHECRDGTCIPFHAVCDGLVDCGDGSDETHALCRGSICQYNWFRCTYGACVDGTAPCDGVHDCADHSDELLATCRNETLEDSGRFRCGDGSSIRSSDHCDGVVNCPDGSDETVRSCAQQQCISYYFQCAYGACIDHGANCNGTIECADGSDESDELCGTFTDKTTTKPIKRGSCIIPRIPEHGRYTVVNSPNAGPGQALEFAQLNISCYSGYGLLGNYVLFCYNGWWTHNMPKCVRFCQLKRHPSVNYRCLVDSSDPELGYRACKDKELSGTLVKPECSPNYFYTGVIPNMHCNDGRWDYVTICTKGTSKNGTNVTLIIKDTVEVFVSSFQYGAPGNISVVVPVTERLVDYDEIDESNWRIGPSSKRNVSTINFNISNSNITVLSNDSIVFRDTRRR